MSILHSLHFISLFGRAAIPAYLEDGTPGKRGGRQAARPWLHPPGLPFRAEIPHQPGPPESHLLFPEHQSLRILYGDSTESTIARGLVHQIVQRIEQHPPQQTWPETERYGAPQEPSKCVIFRKSNALTNRLVVRALKTLEWVIVEKGAIQCYINIIQGEELAGVIRLEFPFFSP